MSIQVGDFSPPPERVKRPPVVDPAQMAYFKSIEMKPTLLQNYVTNPAKDLFGKVTPFVQDHWKAILIVTAIVIVTGVAATLVTISLTAGVPIPLQLEYVWTWGNHLVDIVKTYYSDLMDTLNPYLALAGMIALWETARTGKPPLGN